MILKLKAGGGIVLVESVVTMTGKKLKRVTFQGRKRRLAFAMACLIGFAALAPIAAEAQSAFRLNRPGEQPTATTDGSSPPTKALTAGVSKYDMTTGAENSGLIGNTNNWGLQGAAQNATLSGGTSGMGLQGNAVNTGFMGGGRVGVMPAAPANNAINAAASTVNLKADIVEQMKDHDVVLILDKSGSMSARDCMGLSRWDWVGKQSNKLAQAAQEASSELTLILFSSDFRVFEHVNPATLPNVFRQVGPGGGTVLGGPLDIAFKHYFNSRAANPNVKPLIIVIITDGLPSDFFEVRQRIVEAANATVRDGEISITIMLIGMRSGAGIMEELDSGLNTRRDIVNLVEFDRVLNQGVKSALSDALSGRQMKNVPHSGFGMNSPAYGLNGLLQNLLPGGLRP
ncbi:MAG: VWA domain-containing protein [Candidatus Obscuribacterales bacterium]|nr:VWA domain-containing protein [Candidatus Obscuribacterales bacterium]